MSASSGGASETVASTVASTFCGVSSPSGGPWPPARPVLFHSTHRVGLRCCLQPGRSTACHRRQRQHRADLGRDHRRGFAHPYRTHRLDSKCCVQPGRHADCHRQRRQHRMDLGRGHRTVRSPDGILHQNHNCVMITGQGHVAVDDRRCLDVSAGGPASTARTAWWTCSRTSSTTPSQRHQRPPRTDGRFDSEGRCADERLHRRHPARSASTRDLNQTRCRRNERASAALDQRHESAFT